MTVTELTAHPANAHPVPDRVLVTVRWPAVPRLTVQYRLQGDVEQLQLPAARPAARADGLWRHSCCEVFVGHAGDPGYREFNFSPSGEWAAYRFTARRQGMQPLAGIAPPVIAVLRKPDEVVLEAQFDPGLSPPGAAGQIALGLAVVVEGRDGRHTYWALRHTSSQPDFHDPTTFVLRPDPARAQPSQEPAP